MVILRIGSIGFYDAGYLNKLVRPLLASLPPVPPAFQPTHTPFGTRLITCFGQVTGNKTPHGNTDRKTRVVNSTCSKPGKIQSLAQGRPTEDIC